VGNMRENIINLSLGRNVQEEWFIHKFDQRTFFFLFQNILDEVKTIDLWHLFVNFGRVHKVFIPNKVDMRKYIFWFA